MINQEKTKLKYGYFPEDLAPTSDKNVVWQCESLECKVEHDYSYAYCLKKKAKAKKEKKSELCQKCSHSHRKGISPKQLAIKKPPVALPPELDLGKTMEIYGINADDLSPWSRQKVILKCQCGKESTTKRCSLNSSKSIIETGHYKCVGCCTKDRREGAIVTQETKIKMQNSQKKRRGTHDYSPIPLKPAANGSAILSSKETQNGKVIPFRKK
jgi:hypothetical protein